MLVKNDKNIENFGKKYFFYKFTKEDIKLTCLCWDSNSQSLQMKGKIQ